MTTRDVFTGVAAVPPGARAELAALRAALPGYDVTITSHSPTHRLDATRCGDGTGPWCLISSDPTDLWHELAGRDRPAALDGDRLGPALQLPGPSGAQRCPAADPAQAAIWPDLSRS